MKVALLFMTLTLYAVLRFTLLKQVILAMCYLF